MANLNVENINKIIQSGDVEKFFEGTRLEPAHEARVENQMKAEGMGIQDPSVAGKGFSDLLKESVEKVNLYQTQADTAVKNLVAGRNKNIHETMLTVERADTSLKLMMQVRNKIIDAYREIMRMQV